MGDLGTEMIGGFVLYGRMSVKYDGRASSVLEDGNYLIVRKSDGSTAVHGAQLITPLNYQPAGSKLYVKEWTLSCVSKKEQMIIEVYDVINFFHIDDWSSNRIKLVKTEKELCERLSCDLHMLIADIVSVHKEFPTEYGPIDIVGVDKNNIHHIIEVKRTRISITAATQLRKYMDAVASTGTEVRGYVAAPEILPNALIYCNKHGYVFLKLSHLVI